jgi:adenine-specific DNA-methyltransferase
LIEPEVIVEKLGERGTAWEDFVSESQRLDRIYNGIIFKRHAIIDETDFVVDERVFAGVRERLAHTNSPYDFNSLPVHILGSIYERFLGKVIVTTDKRAKVVEKPEVRKAGGVYYTPAYIVRYIVENTIGTLILDKSPKQIEAMRFADIACGSGSFLLGIFDELLRYHTAYYNRNKTRRTEGLRAGCIENSDGSLRLSLRQKKAILLNNLYGVDLDAQAVEVAQLSLFLKLLEDETTASAKGHQLEFRETMLPSLDKNVIHGNSLIGWDIGGGLFGDEEERKLFPMDFEQVFTEVMRNGGFDAIVGNPPYIQLSMEEFRNEIVNNYLRKTYGFSGGRLNTFAFFFERARQLTRTNGKFSFIVPNTILSQEYYEDLRMRLLNGTYINAVALPQGQIFKEAVVETVVLVVTIKSDQGAQQGQHKVDFFELSPDGASVLRASIEQNALLENYKSSFIVPTTPELLKLRNRLNRENSKFGEWLNINQAIALKHDRAACLTQIKETKEHREILDGRHISRYFTGISPNYFKFDVSKIHSCKREDIFLLPEKILFRRVGDSLIATLDTEQKFALNTLVVITPKDDSRYDLRFVLGLFNSRLLNFYYLNFLKSTKKVFSEIQARQIEQLPLPLLNKKDEVRHDRIVALVEVMLAAKRQLQQARTDSDRNHYENKCAALDRQIDNLVYELYGLTPEEIAIVEGKGE